MLEVFKNFDLENKLFVIKCSFSFLSIGTKILKMNELINYI